MAIRVKAILPWMSVNDSSECDSHTFCVSHLRIMSEQLIEANKLREITWVLDKKHDWHRIETS